MEKSDVRQSPPAPGDGCPAGSACTLSGLFGSFFRIGLFTFGGGYAMIPLIQSEVIERRRWIEAGEFVELLTLAQSSPGPIAINTAVFVGYTMRGMAGAVASLVGAVVPSFTIILLIALFFAGIRHNRIVEAAFTGMRPAVVALIMAPLLSLGRGMHPALWVVVAASALLIWGLGLSPVYLLPAGALCGIAWIAGIDKKVRR